jgi:hypothetical protein
LEGLKPALSIVGGHINYREDLERNRKYITVPNICKKKKKGPQIENVDHHWASCGSFSTAQAKIPLTMAICIITGDTTT